MMSPRRVHGEFCGWAAFRVVVSAVVVWACSDSIAWAGISTVSLFRNLQSIQIGDGDSLVDTGAFFSASLEGTVADEYSSVSMSHPGPDSPAGLSQASSTSYAFQSVQYFIQASMDTNFPTGTYNFAATSNSGTDMTSVEYSGDDYPQSSPYLTGTDYSNLQGMNPAASFDVHFSTFMTGTQADDSFIFFTIYDNTDLDVAFSDSFLSPTTSGLTVPANTLDAGHEFTYQFIYSNRDAVVSTGAVFGGELAFDRRTEGMFSTVPESATTVYLTLLGAILGRIAYCLRGRPSSGLAHQGGLGRG